MHTKQLSILGDIDFSDNGPGKTKVLAKVGIILTQSQLIFVTTNSSKTDQTYSLVSYQVPSNPTGTDPTILSSFGTTKLINLGSEDPPICLHHQAASQSLILLGASGTIHILSKTLNHEQKTLKFAMKKVGKISLSY